MTHFSEIKQKAAAYRAGLEAIDAALKPKELGRRNSTIMTMPKGTSEAAEREHFDFVMRQATWAAARAGLLRTALLDLASRVHDPISETYMLDFDATKAKLAVYDDAYVSTFLSRILIRIDRMCRKVETAEPSLSTYGVWRDLQIALQDPYLAVKVITYPERQAEEDCIGFSY
ncbi:hypothetical protein [Amorphus sp. 3PC139-8]|uniref:hypothetical protein n=1 Tax=Amorphus sp. 3PC139-8 TaxID=2735676 RepID=UPI00345CFD07